MEFKFHDDIDSSENKKLSILYSKYKSNMLYIAFSILNDKEQAKDAVHDAFIRLTPYMTNFNLSELESRKTKALLLMTIKSASIDRYRKNKTENKYFIKDSDLTERLDSKSKSIKTVEDRHLITQILKNLPPKYREIIKYHSYYGLTYTEISKTLNISKELAAKRFERAKNMVNEIIGDEKYE